MRCGMLTGSRPQGPDSFELRLARPLASRSDDRYPEAAARLAERRQRRLAAPAAG